MYRARGDKHGQHFIKGPYADHILVIFSPMAQQEVVYFFISNESPYFSNCKSKISASNSFCTLEDTTKSVKLNGIPEKIISYAFSQ